MIHVDLFTRDGRFVERVFIPPFTEGNEPEAIAWGARFFVRGTDGAYREGLCWQAYTERETEAMAR